MFRSVKDLREFIEEEIDSAEGFELRGGVDVAEGLKENARELCLCWPTVTHDLHLRLNPEAPEPICDRSACYA
jgi:hypothetical protein